MNAADRFVNPFAFVPALGTVQRRPWLGHLAAGSQQRYSGTITATWTLKTPFLLPQNAKQEGWLGSDGKLCIPGSAVKGAVRSLHEAMFNGCLRIIDDDYTPAYREPASGFDEPDDWRLAIVTASHGGVPTQFQLTDANSTEWVDARALHAVWPGNPLPTSGDIAHIFGPRTDANLDRREVRSVSKVDVLRRATGKAETGHDPSKMDTARNGEAGTAMGGGRSDGLFPTGRIFLVTDTAARKTDRKDGSRANCYWASGELSERVVDFNHKGEDKSAWAAFTAACRGSDDRRRLEQTRKAPGAGGDPQDWRSKAVYAEVSWPPQRPGSSDTRNRRGRRTQQSGFLFRGDVVWVKYRGDRVEQIRLAQIWRKPGSGSVKDRIGDAGPCPRQVDGTTVLCLSCATFGSATTDGKRGDGEQTSYAGHVRFSTAESSTAVRTRNVTLAPMGTPNPGSGAFYLRMDSIPPTGLEQDEIPSHWGVADRGRPNLRPIGGRKFYWHADPDEQAKQWARENGRSTLPPRYEDLSRARPSKMSRAASLVEPGTDRPTTITATISVDQLDQVGVDALLASLDPARVLHLTQHHKSRRPTYAIHLGGGKPFGLGSATVQLKVDLTTSRERYASAQPASVAWPELGTEPGRVRLKALFDRVGSFGGNLEALAVLLDLKGLGDLERYVTYPPGASWQEFGSQQFRQSYEFFQETNGQQLARSRREWLTLPQVRPGQDQSLPIRTKRGRRR